MRDPSETFPDASAGAHDGTVASDPAVRIAVVLSVLWLLAVAATLIILPSGAEAGFSGMGRVAALVAIILPVGLIWVAALSIRAAGLARAETLRLRAAVEAIRGGAAAHRGDDTTALHAKLDEISRAQRKTEAALAQLAKAATPPQPAPAPASRPAASPAQRPAADPSQPALALPGPPDSGGEPISNADFLRALNFPEDERDAEGFRALRVALKDRFSAELIRSAQDILTLLAEDGIYMDDLAPDRARPEVWRRFAVGERGREIAALGGVRDRSSLALTTGRMRQDAIFRDVAHHFLRKFDHALAAFEPRASDLDLATLSETRTARAFMLLGRVSGTFD